MNDRESTARSRELGAALRRVRESAGYSGVELANLLGWSQSLMSRLETGKRGVSERHVIAVLAVCGVTGKEFDDLLGLCQETYSRSWLQIQHSSPDAGRTLVHHESTARLISEYNPLTVPDLLQTKDYAHAVLRFAEPTAAEAVETWTRARMDRQAIFQQRHTKSFAFFISEHVLHSPIGGTVVMNDQLLHLVLMSSQPHCQLRVLPSPVGSSGLLGGPFRLMEYSNHLPVAYIRNHTTSLFLEEHEDIATYRAILDQLSDLALDEYESRRLLTRLASGYDQPDPRDDHTHAQGPTASSPRPSEGQSAW